MALLNELRQFKGLWLRKTLEDNPQRLAELVNLRTIPEGHLRIRTGVTKPAPIGTSWDASSPMVTGSTTSKGVGGHDLRSPWPVILRKTAGGVFSEDLSQQAFLQMFTAATNGERFYVVSPGGKFSTVVINIGRANANLTLTWYYDSPGGPQALGGVAEQFTSTGEKVVQFSPPTSPTWGGTFYNGYFGWAVYAEITAVGGGPVIPRIAQKRVMGDMPGRQTLVLASADTQASAASLKLWRYGPNTTPLARFLNVDSGSLSAGYDAQVQAASHDGVLYYTNGFVQRRYQGDPALGAAIGFTKPATAGFAAAVGAAGNLTGTLLYAVAYGYGPNGAWGKSQPIVLSGTPPAPTAQKVEITFPTEVTGLNAGIVDVVYVYRSWPLDGASASTYNSVPLYQIAAVSRKDTDGTFPLNGLGNPGYTDNDQNWPFPLEQMDSRDRTPPSRCRQMVFHKNRLILANSREFPARVWPSLAGEYEAFDQFSGNGHQDFTSGGGDEVTGLADFNDMLVVFTNRATHAMLNLDSEDWSVVTIHPEIGCIAPASIQVAYGRLTWLGQNGLWSWDGQNEPEQIGWPLRIEGCSGLVHGMSRAVSYDYGYELEMIPLDRGATSYSTQWPSSRYASLFTKYFYSFRTKEWSVTDFSNAEGDYMQPLCTVRWPHYTDNEGVPAPVYMRHRVADSATDLKVWLGGTNSNDDGTNMAWAVTVPYGPWKSEMLVPEKWEVDSVGIGAPTTTVNSFTVIGEKPVLQSTPASDGSSEMTSHVSGFTTPGTGVAVIQLRAAGTANGGEGYLYAIYLHGRKIVRKQPT